MTYFVRYKIKASKERPVISFIYDRYKDDFEIKRNRDIIEGTFSHIQYYNDVNLYENIISRIKIEKKCESDEVDLLMINKLC